MQHTSLVVRLLHILQSHCKYFPKLSEPSSKLVIMRFDEFIINVKKDNQFEDAVFTWNLSNKEISGLQNLGGYAIHSLHKKLRISKN